MLKIRAVHITVDGLFPRNKIILQHHVNLANILSFNVCTSVQGDFNIKSVSERHFNKRTLFYKAWNVFFFFTKFKGLNGKSQITRLSRASFESLEFESNLKNKLKKSSKRNYFGVKMLTQFLELEKFR